MASEQIVTILRHTIQTALWMGAPLLIIATLVSLLINVIQVLTSLQDATVSTVPRLFAVAAATLLLMPWMAHRLSAFMLQMTSDFRPVVALSFTMNDALNFDTPGEMRTSRRDLFMDSLPLDQLVAAAVFIGARVSGLMVFCPFLGSNAIPARLKAALALLITAVLYPLHGPMQLDLHSWQWAGIVLSEVVIGLMLGLTANFLMEAPMLAGQILGVQMGYSLAIFV